ncbi:DUF308 domain-containing protein [Sphingomonadaceae bacterium jetA1]|jgi:uncharacterized membrane protein HdeD (DUF308 family)|uniref:HdeD family acid-resistance protein n=1 Tax=Facivitalis istanbulensis TaxID=3075838 RepID=UPI003481F3A2
MTDTDRYHASALRAGAGWGWILAYGILSALLGFAAFLFPLSATLAATLVIGAFFIAAGFLSIGAGIFGQGYEERGYAIGFGAISLIIGFIMALEPATGAISITMLVAIWLGLRGVLEIGLGARLRRRRGWLIGLGVLNIILALFVLTTLPWSAMTLPGYILGLSFLFGGINAIASALDHKKGSRAFAL